MDLALLWELLKPGSLRLLTFVSDVGARSPRAGGEDGCKVGDTGTQTETLVIFITSDFDGMTPRKAWVIFHTYRVQRLEKLKTAPGKGWEVVGQLTTGSHRHQQHI